MSDCFFTNLAFAFILNAFDNNCGPSAMETAFCDEINFGTGPMFKSSQGSWRRDRLLIVRNGGYGEVSMMLQFDSTFTHLDRDRRLPHTSRSMACESTCCSLA